jgi:murein DD-endopeptidase MepM/ murein hydrolase activator NlpD
MKKIRFSGLRKFFKGRGFAAALVLSISAVGVSAYVAYNSAVTRLADESGDNNAAFDQDAAAVGNPQGNVPRETDAAQSETVPPPSAPNPNSPNEPCIELCPASINCDWCIAIQEANHFVRPEAPRIMPVEGEVVKPFSGGELVRSNTLGVWRTHDAVDIGANLGTEVRAMQRGTVTEVYENPMWGVCVVIDHGDGVLSSYMSLDKAVRVEVGAQVEAGDVIGLVGNTAEAEIADPPSLHFAVRVNDEWVDPIAYVRGEEYSGAS